MFGKRREVPEQTIIGRGTSIDGTVSVEGNLQVDGHIDGHVEARGEVSIGPEGVILGELIGNNVTVGGRVEGTLLVRGHLRVCDGALAKGDVRYTSLEVERGGSLNGQSRRFDGNSSADLEQEVQSLRPSTAPVPSGQA